MKNAREMHEVSLRLERDCEIFDQNLFYLNYISYSEYKICMTNKLQIFQMKIVVSSFIIFMKKERIIHRTKSVFYFY